eukprot:CAMPEP_0174259446 /NCGR_PEP_ID=MMETSP0439-20130205/8266_1 /TAXON_ID=0 /ORGANISM="Stereomyxa ramosa, Strain Chinc5" /LENGTH=233 /DNA_ID=CAMNT_0015343335 /DNA_START=36 /DNA_END=737 /DNA_ORIENTATION=+
MQNLTNRKINFNALGDFSDISSDVRHHLCRVYVTLAATVVASAAGAYFHVLYNVGGLLTFLGALMLVISIVATQSSSPTIQPQRLGMLLGLGFFQGCSIGPLIAYALHVDPNMIVTAFALTLAIFGSFSGFALFSKRRSMLYLGGFLFSGLSMLFWMSFLNLFFGSVFIFNLSLYGGLLLFCGFIVFDTQLVIERASLGNKDVVMHSLDLFLDFLQIFVRILAILAKKEKKRN